MKDSTKPPSGRLVRPLWQRFARAASAAIAAPIMALALLYLVLLITPLPLPFLSQPVRALVLSSMPEGSELELGEMDLALEGFVWPVIRFSPVTYTDDKSGGSVTMDALEVGFSPIRALVGQPGATVTVVGPHLQVNQDIFGPRLAKFEYVDDASGNRTVRVIEGETAFPDVALSKKGVNVSGLIPSPAVGIRSDNDWLIYNLEAAGQGVAGIIEQARQGRFSRLVVRDGTLDMNDALYGVFRTFKNITLDVAPSADARRAGGLFSAEFAGTTMSGQVDWAEQADGSAHMGANIVNFDPSAISPMIGDPTAMVTALGTMSVSMDIGFSAKKTITDGLFHLDLTGMDLKIEDMTLPIATSVAEVKWEPGLGQFTMARSRVSVGDNTAEAEGVFRIGLDTQYGSTISMAVTGYNVSIPSDLGVPEKPFDEMKLTGWSAPLYGATGIDQFELTKVDGSRIVATGRIDMLRRGAGFDLTVAGDKMSADDLKRIWPTFISPESRDWFKKLVTAGRLKPSKMHYSFPVGSFDPATSDQPLPENSIAIDIASEGVVLKPTEAMAAVPIDGEMRVTVRDARVTIAADGASVKTDTGDLAAANVAFSIGSDAPDNVIYEISGDVSGGLPALIGFVDQVAPGALKRDALPIKPESLSGKLSVSLLSTIVMGRDNAEKPRSFDYALNGVVQDFGAAEPLEGHRISNGQLTLHATPAGYAIGGTADVDGIGAEVKVAGKAEEGAPPPELTLSATLDAKDFKKLGFDVSEFISGPVTFAARPMPGGSIQMVADVEKAALTIKDLGITKPKGVAGKAQAEITIDGDAISVSKVDIGFGDVSLKGQLALDAKTGLKSANFSDLKLSPDDNAQLTLVPTEGGYAVKVSGEQLDLKPMLKRFFSLSGDSTGGPQATAVDKTIAVEVALKRALGFYKTTAFNLNVDMALRGADLLRVSLQANLGDNRNVSITTNPTPAGKSMAVAFDDLGELLRFVNVYPNIQGGEGLLRLDTVKAEKLDNGTFALRNFAFVNEANVAQVLRNHSESRQLLQSNSLAFKSAQVEFVRKKDRLEIKDALLAGPMVGGTARGFIYIDKRQYDLTGTYVPLFGLNNAFSKLLGPLAGRQGEGLFGVTFAVRGPLDNPQFRINPMSALVPGAFRRLFEFRAKELPDAP